MLEHDEPPMCSLPDPIAGGPTHNSPLRPPPTGAEAFTPLSWWAGLGNHGLPNQDVPHLECPMRVA